MRFKFTAFLLILNVIAFGLILFLSKQTGQNNLQSAGLSKQIGREVIEADHIVLKGRALETPRVLQRDGAAWQITEPLLWPANYFAVNRILNQLQFLEEEASFSIDEIEHTGHSLSDYGLQDPLLTLSIGSGTDAIDLNIGSPTDIGNNVYLLGPDKKDIYVVSRKVIDSLLVDLADLRSGKIFDIPVFEVEALGLQIRSSTSTASNGELKVRIARTTSGWILEAPLNADADPSRVSNVINTLSAVKVERFPEGDDPVLQGLENPFMRVTLQGNKREQILLLGNKDPGAQGEPSYFARLDGNPTVFTVPAAPFDELQKAQEALRERNFMNFDPTQLDAIHITEGELQIRLQKLEAGADWQVICSDAGTEIQPYRADEEVLIELIKNLKSLRASGFALDAPTPGDLDRLGFNTPRRSIALINSDGSQSTLLLAHPVDENMKLYARLDDTDFIYELERRPTLNALSLNELKYRNRALDTLPEAARIQSVKLESLETGDIIFEYSQGEAPEPWIALLAEKPEAERNATLQIIDDIRRFKVKNYLLDHYADAYPVDQEKSLPWAFKLSAQILLPGDDDAAREDTRTYVFTKRLSGTVQVGGSARHDSIFEIRQETLDAIYQLTEDMPLPPEATGQPIPDPQYIEPVPAPSRPTTASEELDG